MNKRCNNQHTSHPMAESQLKEASAPCGAEASARLSDNPEPLKSL